MRRIRAAVATLLCFVSITSGTAAAATVSGGVLISNDDALQTDLAAYSRTFGVDMATASAQVGEVSSISSLQAQLEAEFPDTFGGVWIEHVPYRVVVAAKSDGADQIGRVVSGVKLSVAPVVRVVARSYAELRSIGDTMAATDLGPIDLAINIRENTVDVETMSAATVTAALTRLDARSPAVRVLNVPELAHPTANIYGGLGGANHQWSGCMSGFTVLHVITAGVTEGGILTAGHCGNPLSYQSHNLPMILEWHQTNADAQWHTVPGFTAQPEFIVDALQDRRFATATKSRAAQVVGEPVCKYGVVTSYGCGTVDIKDFRPNPLDANWVDNPSFTFIRAQNCLADLSQPGDSGGPIFYGNTAFGIMSGREVDIFCSNHTKAIYTAIDLAVSHFPGVSVKLH